MLALDFYYTSQRPKPLRLLVVAAASLVGLSIAYSRLILGMHSIDQVIFGLLLGYWCALVCHYIIKPLLDPEVKALIECKATDLKQRLVWSAAVFLLLYGFSIVQYTTVDHTLMAPEWQAQSRQWIANIGKAKPKDCTHALKNGF